MNEWIAALSHIINSYSLRTRRKWADIYITNAAVGRVGYYQLISGKSEKKNCFSKFSTILLISSGETSSNCDIFFTEDAAKKIFPTSKISAQEIVEGLLS